MTKRLEVTMPDGSVWAVPAMLVAEPRARYYAEVDTKQTSGTDFDVAYLREIEESVRDTDELIDWAHNNMNWSEVSASARLVSGPPAVDFQEGWLNGEMRVVDAP